MASSYYFCTRKVTEHVALRVGGGEFKIKKRNLTQTLTLTVDVLLSSIVFHNKSLYHNFCGFFIFTAYSKLIYYMRRQYQLDYM